MQQLGKHLLDMGFSLKQADQATDAFTKTVKGANTTHDRLKRAAAELGVTFKTTGQITAEAAKKEVAARLLAEKTRLRDPKVVGQTISGIQRDSRMAKAYGGQLTRGLGGGGVGSMLGQKQTGGALALGGVDKAGRRANSPGVLTKQFSAAVKEAGLNAKNAAAATKSFSASLAAGKSSAAAASMALKQVGVSGGLVSKEDYNKIKAARMAANADMKKAGAASGKGGMGGMGGMSMGLMMGAGMLMQFTSKLEGSSKAVADGLLQMVMMVAMVMMALESFGIKLTLTGTGFGNMLAGAAIGVVAFMAISKIIDDVTGVHKKSKKAIEDGNVAKARETAAYSQASKDADILGYAAVGVGAAIAGPLGAGIGVLVGGLIKLAAQTEMGAAVMALFRDTILVSLGMDSTDLILAKAEADAAGVAAMKALTEASKEASENLQKVQAGKMGVDEALGSDSMGAAGRAMGVAQKKRAAELDQLNKKGSSYKVGQGWQFGMVGMIAKAWGSSKAAKRFDEKTIEDRTKTAEEKRELLGDEGVQSLMNIKARQTSFAGGDFNSFFADLKKNSPELANVIGQEGGTEWNNARKMFEGVEKEVERVKTRMAALNLGLRDMTAATSATAVGMDNLMNRFKVGSLQLDESFSILSAGVTEAGAHMDQSEFDAALGDVEQSMKAFGANEKQLKKFTAGLRATQLIQSQAKDIFDKDFIVSLNQNMSSGGKGETSPDKIKKRFADAMINALPTDLQDEVGGQLRDLISTGAISNEDMEAFQGKEGDVSVITGLVEELVKRQQDLLETHHERLNKFNLQLITVTKERIDSERKLIAAQKTALDMQMEARTIASKYGGAAYGGEEKRKLLLEKANVGAGGMGLGNLAGGSVGELRRRNAQIGMNFSNIERSGQVSDASGKRIAGGGSAAVAVDERQKDLMKANKDHATLIRSLIKLEEEELQILEKKNALEKESLTALMKGDLEGFLQQQAAVGATAAIATGDKGMMGMFGADALAGAFENIKTQQEGGVQSLYGQQLGGAGGLKERGAHAALSARGMTSLQAAKVAAGTTPEEERRKRNIRGMAGALSETGDVGAGMAGMQVKTAEMRVDLANIEITNLQNTPITALQAKQKAGGGLIYANNGMFVPRGTDTVPAMLTPGEFVVRRQSVQRGNNLQILRAMNGGEAGRYQYGGQVEYLRGGGRKGVGRGGASVGLDPTVVANLATSLSMFNSSLATNIQNLKDMKFQIKLDTTNINVTLNGTSFLASLSGALKSELMAAIGEKIKNTGFNSDGTMVATTGPLGDTQAVG